jgi:ABC-type nitrate/sulfonate/bicarbonate transport system permease component
VLSTVETIAIGFGLAVGVGVGLGLPIGRNETLSLAYEPLIASLFTIPIVVLYPMLVGQLGVSREPEVLVAFLAAVFPILLASISAARQVDPRLMVAMRSLGAGPIRRTLLLTLPACLPRVFTGLRSGLGLCGVTVVAAEYIASLKGLGYQLAQTSESLQTPSLYAWVVVTLAVMALLNVCLGIVQFTVEQGVKR